MTKESEAVKAVKQNGPMRMHTIRRGLKPLVQSQAIADVLRDFSERSGITRHVVSLVANQLLLSSEVWEVDNWFHWYTRVWTAVDYAVNPKGLNNTEGNPCIAPVKRVFRKYPVLLQNLRLAVPERVPVMARQQECNTMAVATQQHIKGFTDRVFSMMTVKVTNIIWNLHGDVRCVKKAAGAAKSHILADPEKASEGALRSKLLKIGVTAREATAIVLLSRAERLLLGELASSPDYRRRWTYVLKCDNRCWQLIPHLKRYSAYMSEFMETEYMLPPEQGGGPGEDDAAAQEAEEEAEKEEEEEEEEDDDAVATEEPLPSERRKWTRFRKPKPFTILPVFKLQASMMYYGYTEVKALFGYIHGKEMEEFERRYPKVDRPKRKRGVTLEAAKEAADAHAAYEEKRASKRPIIHTPDPLYFARGVLRERRMVKDGVNLPGMLTDAHANDGWKLTNFRTNGVVVCLTFGSNSEAVVGVEELMEKDYTTVPVCYGVDVATCQRGLWHLRQTDGTVSCSSPVRVISVDPGLHKPVQWSKLQSDVRPVDMPQHATFGDIDESTWSRLSGRTDRCVWEKRRRAANANYSKAIDAFSGVLRRTANGSTFSNYVKVCASTLVSRIEELCHRRRSLRSWLSQRRLQSFISRVANRIAHIDPNRMKTSRRSLHGSLLSPEERQALLGRIRQRRKEKKQTTVVFFGDGEFNHAMRGHISIPKKSILHELGTRVPTILIDEYNTSSKCVCGLPLRNATNDSACRVRVHKDGGDCHALRCGICDRDELATLNIAQASMAALAQQAWPAHLLRPSSRTGEHQH